MATTEMNCLASGGGGNIESISAQAVSMSSVGMQISIADAHKAVLIAYKVAGGNPEQYLTINGNAPDDYSVISNATYMMWMNTPANSILTNTAGTWGVDMIYLD